MKLTYVCQELSNEQRCQRTTNQQQKQQQNTPSFAVDYGGQLIHDKRDDDLTDRRCA